MSTTNSRVSAVIVDFHADLALGDCVDSLRANGVSPVVVVENGEPGSTPPALGERSALVVEPGVNLGYGRGANRGVACVDTELVLITNPDVVLHDGAVSEMVAMLDAHPTTVIVGPKILRPDGSVYPSHRVFPNIWLAAAHALLAPWWPDNPATRRYRAPRRDGTVDWVSGACFLVRRQAFEAVGGFDERFFMFAEDMKLCWDLRTQGGVVRAVDGAIVTHVEGLSRARASRSMVWAHHRSALRFEALTATGWRRALVPVAGVVLALRLIAVLAKESGPSNP